MSNLNTCILSPKSKFVGKSVDYLKYLSRREARETLEKTDEIDPPSVNSAIITSHLLAWPLIGLGP